MAQTITYDVGINPIANVAPNTALSGGSQDSLILSDVNVTAIRLLLSKIKAGVDVSTVVTAINALP